MKRKNILKKLSILVILMTPTIVFAEEKVKDYIVCGNNKKFPTIVGTMISTIYVIIRILVPLLLVIFGIISFLKATIASKEEDTIDKARKTFVKNLTAAVIIFFIVSILNFIIRLVAGTNNSFIGCVNCMIHPKNCQTTNGEISHLCPGLIGDQEDYDENCEYKGTPKERTDYSTGDSGIEEIQHTTPTINRTLTDNPNALTNQNIITKTDAKSTYNYYLYVPKQVDDPNSLPLIVYLHDNGKENGYTYDLMKNGFGFAKYIEQGMEFNAYILMPQKHSGKQAWDTQAIKRIIDNEVETNNIDKRRISIWGYSAGAEALPRLVNSHPNFFSSAVILAKGYDANTEGFKTVPTYGFYGTADSYANPKNPTKPKVGTPYFINELKENGFTAYVKAYEGVDHDHVMEQLMHDNNIGNGYNTIMNWVLDQKRSN
jgi:predicted esterase